MGSGYSGELILFKLFLLRFLFLSLHWLDVLALVVTAAVVGSGDGTLLHFLYIMVSFL